MIGKIDSNGHLMLGRQGVSHVYCPFNTTEIVSGTEGNVQCGDWCALFGEPESEQVPPSKKGDAFLRQLFADEPTGRTILHLCQGVVHVFDEFTDERSAE
jgi:hypothetical protein